MLPGTANFDPRPMRILQRGDFFGVTHCQSILKVSRRHIIQLFSRYVVNGYKRSYNVTKIGDQ